MKKLILNLLIMALTVATCFCLVGCDDKKEEDTTVTGNFTYEIVTVADGVEAYDENGNVIKDGEETKKFEKYYKVTGFTISSDDEKKMDVEDYSTVTKYQTIQMPKTYKDLEGATEDYPVLEIGVSAFSGNRIFKNVTVGGNYGIIEEGAFAGVSNLESLSLPFVGKKRIAVNQEKLFGYIFGTESQSEGFTACTSKYFYYLSGTEDISSAEDITYNVPTSLTKVEIRGGEIATAAFSGMSTLTSISIPNAITEINPYVFYNCTGLEKFVMGNVETVYQSAFSGCTNLIDLTFSASLKTIYEKAFYNCSSLGKDYLTHPTFKLPNAVEFIGESAFSGCGSISKLDLSNIQANVISVGAFQNATALQELTLKAGSTIRTGAFTGCTYLKQDKVTNYDSVTLQVNAFDF